MKTHRRDFLRNTLLTGIGASLSPLSAAAATADFSAPQSGTLTLLQTTDVHCQIHPHDEMFWENEKMVWMYSAFLNKK
jgi:2',3'-cyclic-nucleotide 2'-phosphodiesterase (5'-nucleotidase family)